MQQMLILLGIQAFMELDLIQIQNLLYVSLRGKQILTKLDSMEKQI